MNPNTGKEVDITKDAGSGNNSGGSSARGTPVPMGVSRSLAISLFRKDNFIKHAFLPCKQKRNV